MSDVNTPHALGERVRLCLQDLRESIVEKRMFGGTTFLLNGNMLCCISKTGLMVRVGVTAEPEALNRPHAQPCLGTGRPMPGFISVTFEGLQTDRDLSDWLFMARAYVEPMPAK